MCFHLFERTTVAAELRSFQPAFMHEPDITPNLSQLSLDLLPIALLVLINCGYRREQALQRYLSEHGARFARQTVSDVLRYHTATLEAEDGLYDGLWRSLPDGSFAPIVTLNEPHGD